MGALTMTIYGQTKHWAIATTLLIVVVIGLVPLQAQQRAPRFIISVGAGPALFPMREWSDYAGEIRYSRYEYAPISLTAKLSVGLHLNEISSLNLEIEQLVSFARLFYYPIVEDPSGPSLGVIQLNTTQWIFTAIPVTLSYLHHFRNSSAPWVPYLGLGMSYYSTEVEARYTLLYDPWNIGFPVAEETARKDSGYGTVAVAGMNVPMFGRLHLTPQLRYRWADASAFGGPDKTTISFTGYDFSVGISWNP